ncbi:MAG: hypothetical protein ACREHG_06215, partial [Candidatus Saccharimonadales bacterium]
FTSGFGASAVADAPGVVEEGTKGVVGSAEGVFEGLLPEAAACANVRAFEEEGPADAEEDAEDPGATQVKLPYLC